MKTPDAPRCEHTGIRPALPRAARFVAQMFGATCLEPVCGCATSPTIPAPAALAAPRTPRTLRTFVVDPARPATRPDERGLRELVVTVLRDYGTRGGTVDGLDPASLTDAQLWAAFQRDMTANPGSTVDGLCCAISQEATAAEIAADPRVRTLVETWAAVLEWECDAHPATLAAVLAPAAEAVSPGCPPLVVCRLAAEVADYDLDLCPWWVRPGDDAMRGPAGATHTACQRSILDRLRERVHGLTHGLVTHPDAEGTRLLVEALDAAMALAAETVDGRSPSPAGHAWPWPCRQPCWPR